MCRSVNRHCCCPLNPMWRPWSKSSHFNIAEEEPELQGLLEKACRLEQLLQLRDNGKKARKCLMAGSCAGHGLEH